MRSIGRPWPGWVTSHDPTVSVQLERKGPQRKPIRNNKSVAVRPSDTKTSVASQPISWLLKTERLGQRTRRGRRPKASAGAASQRGEAHEKGRVSRYVRRGRSLEAGPVMKIYRGIAGRQMLTAQQKHPRPGEDRGLEYCVKCPWRAPLNSPGALNADMVIGSAGFAA